MGRRNLRHQVEGAANEDGRGPSIWDVFSRVPGDVACDQYHRLEENLDLVVDLDIQACRFFSVAWPRIQSEGSGPASWKGLDHYRRLVDGLRERRIVPMLTLYYWNLPQALGDRGGWTSRETSERFAEYAGIVYEALRDNVPFWITLNEPWVSAWLGADGGMRPPARRGVGRRVDEEDENALVSERRQTSMRGEDKP